MRVRLLLLALLVAADLLLLPAVARLPEHLVLRPRQSQQMARWRQEWLQDPIHAALSIVRPDTAADVRARQAWQWLQLFMAAAALGILWPAGGRPALAERGVPGPHPAGTHGTARWRDARNLVATLNRTRIGRGRPAPGFVIGVDRPRRPRYAYQVPGPVTRAAVGPHVLVIGSTGSRKTRGIVLPSLWQLGQATAAGHPASAICTDPKGELYRWTARYFRDLGYQVRTLNLIDPLRSDGYDPIREITAALERGDTSAASEAAWDVGNLASTVESNRHTREEPIWRQGSESLIAATTLYTAANAPHGQRTMGTVYRIISEYGQDGGQLLDEVFRSIGDLSSPARQAYAVTGLAQDRTRASILTTVAANLRLYADPGIAAMTARSDYDLASIGRTPTVVYLMLPDNRPARNAIAAMYLAQTYSALCRLADGSPGGALPVSVMWVLDEFANLGQFRDFDQWLAVMRGRGMAAMIILQTLQQLEARYGADVSRVISGNCDTWALLRTNDRMTAREFSDKMGQYTIRLRGASATTRRWDTSTGTSEHLAGRPLLTPDEVLRWAQGTALVLQAGHYPARLPLADISEWPAALGEGDLPPVRKDPPLSSPWLPSTRAAGKTAAVAERQKDPRSTVPREDLQDLTLD